jgi:predicted dinucleotide-binding enzyme
MKIAIIGAGKIGGNIATQLSKAGHDVTICFSRHEDKLQQRAAELGKGIRVATVAKAAQGSEALVFAMPWSEIDTVLAEIGDVAGKVVIDATNQYVADGLANLPSTVAEYNQKRLPGAYLVRAFNMFFASFEAEVGAGQHRPVAMFFVTDHQQAILTAEQIIRDTGFEPVYLGGSIVAGLIEAPDGMLIGKKYTPEIAAQIAAAAQSKDIYQLQKLIHEVKS